MSFYEDLVMQTQMNYSRYYGVYAAGKIPYELTDKKALPYEKQIETLLRELEEADCVVAGGASGLSAAGGGDFYGGWMRDPHSAMISCNDGFRPVSFYIEAV